MFSAGAFALLTRGLQDSPAFAQAVVVNHLASRRGLLAHEHPADLVLLVGQRDGLVGSTGIAIRF